MNLFIIIPVYNRKKLTRNCLKSLYHQTYKDFKIIIVDDGSTDKTDEMIKEEFSEVILIKTPNNYWFTKSINLGFKYALKNNADYILTLNNDDIVSKNFIENHIKWLKRYSNIIMSSLIVDIDTKQIVEPIMPKWNWGKGKKIKNRIFYGVQENCELFPAEILSGKGLLIPKKAFEIVGLYDENRFPQGHSDLDYVLRAKKKGFKLYWNYDAVLYAHLEKPVNRKFPPNHSFKDLILYFTHIKSSYNIKTHWYFIQKYFPNKLYPFYFLRFLLVTIIKYFISWAKQLLN